MESSAATDLNVGADITGLAVSGKAAGINLIAGAASCAEVYFSNDGGRNWQKATKPPSGQSKTDIVIAQDGAYAATSGNDSAFSTSTDGGITWNQLSLIDTSLTTIVDLAPSPRYQEDETIFLLTFGGEHSLWRTLNGEKTWERVFSSSLGNVDTFDSVRLPPQYDSENEAVFIAGTSNGNPATWQSIDNGQTFACRAVPFPIDTWAVVNNATLFIGSFDGTSGLVYRSTNGGVSLSEGAVAGNQSLNSIAISPAYPQDESLLVGNSDGWVFWSNDIMAYPLPHCPRMPPQSL
jgi:photosystem II stability/assembly factor-like uncharacterized protein